MKRRKRQGFTIIEMLAVIVVIAILVGGLAMIIPGIIERGKIDETEMFIKTLSEACKVYKRECFTWPPNNVGGSSRSLHYYLSRTRNVAGSTQVNVKPRTADPYVVFKQAHVEGGGPLVPNSTGEAKELMDLWLKPLLYTPPSPATSNNPVTIKSSGKDESMGTVDDIDIKQSY